MKDLVDLEELIKDIHETAKQKGWWDVTPNKPERTFGDVVALIHSELSEALEFERKSKNLKAVGINHLYHYAGGLPVTFGDSIAAQIKELNIVPDNAPLMSNEKNDICKKPDGLLPELADAVIRVFDYVGKLGMEEEFVKALTEKHEFNKTRPYRHGGKTL